MCIRDSYPIDREFVAAELGFEGLCENSLDAVSDRDFAIEFCAASALLMMHFSRMSEELVPVSYTHLDVYKRQITRGACHKRSGVALSSSSCPVRFRKLSQMSSSLRRSRLSNSGTSILAGVLIPRN